MERHAPQRQERMTPLQLERRRRAVDAVHDLLRSTPVAELQMKDIAERAGVSLAAIYNYFSSKEHLLAEVLVDWVERGRAPANGRRPSAGATLGERFGAVLRRGVRAYQREPQYAELLLVTVASRDENALMTFGRLSGYVGGSMRDALSGLDDETIDTIVGVFGSAWVGGLFDCVHGRSTFADLERSMTAGSRLLLDPLEARLQPELT